MSSIEFSIYRLQNLDDLLDKRPTIRQLFQDKFFISTTTQSDTLDFFQFSSGTAFFEALNFLSKNGFAETAFKSGLNIKIGSLGLLDFYLTSCGDIQQAFNAIVKYFPLISTHLNNCISLTTHTKNNGNEICSFAIHPADNSNEKTRLEVEFTLGIIMALFKRLTQQRFPATLSLPYHSFASSCYDLLTQQNIQIKLNRPQFSFSFDANILHQSLSFASENTRNVLVPELDQQLSSLNLEGNIISRILALFAEIELPQVSQTIIAEALNMSESSLKRKLSECDTTFTNLLNRYKKEKSLHLLCSEDLSFEQIALQTGYSDRASFERAFKKWICLTPAQFRRQSSLSKINSKLIKAADIHAIPPSPKVCQQVISLTQADDFKIATLAELITADPVLTGKLMGVANSAFYGGQNITDLNQAIVRVLGVTTVQNLTISMMCCRQLDTSQCAAFDLSLFWTVSLATAESSKYFASSPRILNNILPAELYLASLLHQIGLLSLVHLRPYETHLYLQNMTQQLDNSTEDFSKLETNIFGVTLAEMGALVLTHWGLPQSVCQVVRALVFSPQNEAAQLIHILSQMTKLLIRHNDGSVSDEYRQKLLTITGLSLTQIDNNINRMSEQLPAVICLAESF